MNVTTRVEIDSIKFRFPPSLWTLSKIISFKSPSSVPRFELL